MVMYNGDNFAVRAKSFYLKQCVNSGFFFDVHVHVYKYPEGH